MWATLQVKNTGPGSNDGLYTWITSNGSAVANTAALIGVGASNTSATRSFMLTMNSNDYVQYVARAAPGNVGTLQVATATSTGVPTGASVTFSIREV